MNIASDTPDKDDSKKFDIGSLEQLRKRMFLFAINQLNDINIAEDVVQETLIGALRNQDSFNGHAAWNHWVFSILKHKIADALRARYREKKVRVFLHEDEGDDDFSSLFDEHGHWPSEERPQAWSCPDAALHQAHFWRVFECCLKNLPANQERVFMMREFLGLSNQEICHTVEINNNNLNVLLYRARMRLRECLTLHWFNNKEEEYD